MSCTITVDANGTVTRNYTGDVSIQLTSANSGTGYQPPTCSSGKSHSVPEPGTIALFAFALLLYGVGRICHYPFG